MDNLNKIKEIVVISGKGGTGKTTLLSCFAALSDNVVIADCDVDAADLHLILSPDLITKQRFKSGKVPVFDSNNCISCLTCMNHCRFDAITFNEKTNFPEFNLVSCEGCGFCARLCVNKAISMQENEVGDLYVSKTKYGTFVHAKLGAVAENSGKLVSEVKKIAKKTAETENKKLILIDGAPGTGCAVIASLSGVEKAIIVLEPTVSGLHDGKRIVDLCKHFKINIEIIVNKYDLNLDVTEQINLYCKDNNISLLGKIPFDENIVKALVDGKIFIEYINNDTTKIIKDIWQTL